MMQRAHFLARCLCPQRSDGSSPSPKRKQTEEPAVSLTAHASDRNHYNVPAPKKQCIGSRDVMEKVQPAFPEPGIRKSDEHQNNPQLFQNFLDQLSSIPGVSTPLSPLDVEKAKYVFSKAIFIDGDHTYLDLSNLPMADLLCPERRLPSGIALCINNTLAAEAHTIKEIICKSFNAEGRSLSKAEKHSQENIEKCADDMADIRLMIPFLAKLGAAIEKKLPCSVPPVLQEQEKYGIHVKSSYINRRDKAFYEESYSRFCHQEYKWLATNPSRYSIPELPDVMCEALEALSDNGFFPCAAPTFLGYIESKYANEWARQNSFIDHNCTLNFTHGTHIHLVQSAFMSNRSMSGDTLKGIVDRDLWDLILDRNCYQTHYIHPASGASNHLLICGHELSLQGYSPHCIYEKLLTGQLSEAVSELSRDPDVDTRLPRIAITLGLASLTQKDLTEIASGLRDLENYTACMALNDRHEIRKSLRSDIADTGLHTGGQGDFKYDSLRQESVRKTAARFFDQGRTILAYIPSHRRFPAPLTCPAKVTSLRDIYKQGSCFVVLPEKTTHPVLPEHARRFFPEYDQTSSLVCKYPEAW